MHLPLRRRSVLGRNLFHLFSVLHLTTVCYSSSRIALKEDMQDLAEERRREEEKRQRKKEKQRALARAY